MKVDYISALDTRRFGFNIGKIDDPEILCAPGFREILSAHNVRLVISRIATEELSTIHALEEMGFRIMDVQTTWKISTQLPPDRGSFNNDVNIREAQLADAPVIQQIATGAFDNYGHYFADQRLNKARCREIYPDWAGRTLTVAGVADKVFVAEYNNRLAGYLAFKILEKDSVRYTASVMGAVAEGSRGKNVYSSLVIESLVWGNSNGLAWQEQNVLAVNYPVNRVFSKLGFHQAGSFITLHYWAGDRPPAR